MSSASFSLKFSNNTYITNTNMKKKYKEIPIFPNFTNFGPKFPDPEFIMVLSIIYFLKDLYHKNIALANLVQETLTFKVNPTNCIIRPFK